MRHVRITRDLRGEYNMNMLLVIKLNKKKKTIKYNIIISCMTLTAPDLKTLTY